MLSLLSGSCPSFADDAPTATLSLESVIIFALDNNPNIKAQAEKVKQARFAIDEARAAYYPQISATLKGGHGYSSRAATSPTSGGSGKIAEQFNSYDSSVIIDQVLFNGFATDEEVYRRQNLATSAGYTALLAIESTLQDAVTYYVDVWRYQRDLQESEEFVADIEKIGQKVSMMSEAGAESKAKKEYVDSRVAAAHTSLNAVKAALTDALSNLENLTGPLPPLRSVRPLQFDPTVRPIESYYELGESDSTKLRGADADNLAVQHQLDQQEAAYMPTLDLQVNGDHSYNNGGHVGNTWSASTMLVMNYKIFDGYARDNALGRLKSQKTETVFERAQLIRDLRKDVRKSYNQILATKQDLTSNMKEVLSSERLQDLYQKQFELGEGDIINFIEGAERLHAAKINAHKLEGSMVTQSYTLLQKVGSLRKEKFCVSC